VPELRIFPVEGLPAIAEGDDLGALIAEHTRLDHGDVVVVSQKAVSKAEGRFCGSPTSRRPSGHASWRPVMTPASSR